MLRLKCNKFDFGCSSAPDPTGGSLTVLPAPPGPLTRFKGPKGREGRNSEFAYWSLLKNTVVIVVTVYVSIAVRNNMHFVMYRYCCEGRYSVNIHSKCLEKSGNLIMSITCTTIHLLTAVCFFTAITITETLF